ncbi:serine/threonine-protein kinase [Nocardioides deserti]|uniref:non-specific serine/threonine protein kinase n=1 Tax=Nocardioides deserti TaxID=1588644 RepID=A0ABR6U8Y6_9ACTN|nr:serine/threonine-protein kinase [Nocardioides deserti]MBC2960603.1 protein kinase [Nocardioides deserti]GGO70900.1 serine/threonine protein kinase [Nocardioides deserti]
MELLDERYELRAVLGRGGSAEVHRAWDRVLEREVAVKLLLAPSALEEETTARLRFEAEARLLARLDHPGLVRLLDVGTKRGRPYFVLELVDGGTVAALLPDAPLDPSLVARVGAQVAEALAHAHARGVVHRDVKPANVLLTSEGAAKLADFGIARLLGEDIGVTRTGHTVGTIAYLAPEQVRGEGVGPAVDVYALGLLLLEALTAARAFPGTSTESAFARLHHGPTIPLSLPPGWPRLLAAMTAGDPAERPPAAAVAPALRALATDGPVTAPLPGPAPTVDAATAGPPTRSVRLAGAPARRRTARWVGVAAALVVGAVAALGTLGSPEPAISDEPPTPPPARIQPASELARTATTDADTDDATQQRTTAPRGPSVRGGTDGRARGTDGARDRSEPRNESPGKAEDKAPGGPGNGARSGPQGKAKGHQHGHPGRGNGGRGRGRG